MLLSDPSIDRFKTSAIPILKRFLAGDNSVELKIRKRGAAPLGGGEVHFSCPINKNLKNLQVKIINSQLKVYNLSFFSIIIFGIPVAKQWNGQKNKRHRLQHSSVPGNCQSNGRFCQGSTFEIHS